MNSPLTFVCRFAVPLLSMSKVFPPVMLTSGLELPVISGILIYRCFYFIEIFIFIYQQFIQRLSFNT